MFRSSLTSYTSYKMFSFNFYLFRLSVNKVVSSSWWSSRGQGATLLPLTGGVVGDEGAGLPTKVRLEAIATEMVDTGRARLWAGWRWRRSLLMENFVFGGTIRLWILIASDVDLEELVEVCWHSRAEACSCLAGVWGEARSSALLELPDSALAELDLGCLDDVEELANVVEEGFTKHWDARGMVSLHSGVSSSFFTASIVFILVW